MTYSSVTVDVWTVFVIGKVIRRKEYIPWSDIALFIVGHVQDRSAEIWPLSGHFSCCVSSNDKIRIHTD
jgi:hypothetical protein